MKPPFVRLPVTMSVTSPTNTTAITAVNTMIPNKIPKKPVIINCSTHPPYTAHVEKYVFELVTCSNKKSFVVYWMLKGVQEFREPS